MENIAYLCRYKIEKLEYFNSEGRFHTGNYDFRNGYIFRCSRNYKGRFTENYTEFEKMIKSTPEHLREQFYRYKISYTSLLVDFIYE